jgi:hypothetical protein
MQLTKRGTQWHYLPARWSSFPSSTLAPGDMGRDTRPRAIRTPRYRVRYQLEGQPTHDAMVGPNPRRYLVANIRESRTGDSVELKLSEDGMGIVNWVSRTDEEFWRDFDGT